MKKFTKILSMAFMACMAIALITFTTGVPLAYATGGVLLIGSLVPMPTGVARGVLVETWAPYIIERFYKDNAFLRNAYDDSGNVVTGRIVHIPQIGSKPLVQKNRATFPAVAVRRTDTDVVYALDEYTTDPTHIPNIDTLHLSYSKQDSVLGDHMVVLNEAVADDILVKWAANSANYATTGAQIVNGSPAVLQVPPTTGQTGNRLAFTHRDLKNLMTRMNVDNIPKSERYVLIDDNMFDAFYDTLGETNARDFSQYADANNGIVGRLHGFNIATRSSVLSANNAGTIKAIGAALAGTDNLLSFAWQKNSVAAAIGSANLYQDLNSAIYYGDVHSVSVMAGGRVRREDGKGVYKITQGTV